jgi:carbonic anhydrase
MTRRAIFLLPAAAWAGQTHTRAEKLPSPDQVLEELKAGNRRFAANHSRHPHSNLRWAKKVAPGQHPHAAVLGCADSRVPPEILFDQGIGDLFSVRVAGNVANEDEVASLEYAIDHLGVPLLVVLGHTNCGAVSAVCEGADLPPELDHLVSHIEDTKNAVKATSPGMRGHELVAAVVRLNVLRSLADLIRNGPIVRHALIAHRIKLVGAVYDLANGRVEWLGPHPEQEGLLRPY